MKYGVTENLVADLTVNTDFAQVEADEQQVNLTRFSLFFPEKREFFLENQGLFAFGGESSGGQFAGASNTPILFYSRQIGLHEGREVRIDAGGRLTGRVGKFSVGLLNIHTADAPFAGARATNFSVVRVRRNCPWSRPFRSTGSRCRKAIHYPSRDGADHLHGDAADVCQRPGAVQLQHERHEHQPADALGVSPR